MKQQRTVQSIYCNGVMETTLILSKRHYVSKNHWYEGSLPIYTLSNWRLWTDQRKTISYALRMNKKEPCLGYCHKITLSNKNDTIPNYHKWTWKSHIMNQCTLAYGVICIIPKKTLIYWQQWENLTHLCNITITIITIFIITHE